MRDFATWVSDMAGTIEDASDFIKKSCDCAAVSTQNKPTALQKRMNIADLLVPVVLDTNAAKAWMLAFCVDLYLDANKEAVYHEAYLTNIIGYQKTTEYETSIRLGKQESWIEQFKKDINNGKEFI